MIPDLKAALAHLRWLTGEDNPEVAWQIFDDTKRRPDLARGFHGTLESVKERLIAAQLSGCGVFVSVNETNGRGRRKENMTRYKCVFLDFDGVPLPDRWPINPLLIASSPGKFQAWWKLEPGTDFDAWHAVEMELIERYGADRNCALTTQVGRCAGFWHSKNEPFQVRIVAMGEESPLSLLAFAERFGVDIEAAKAKHARKRTEATVPSIGWDHACDILQARAFLQNEDNWCGTSDGAVSVYRAALALRDFGISPDTAIELIEEFVPCAGDWNNDHVEVKVAHAYRYGQNAPGCRSLAWEDDEPAEDLSTLLEAFKNRDQ